MRRKVRFVRLLRADYATGRTSVRHDRIAHRISAVVLRGGGANYQVLIVVLKGLHLPRPVRGRNDPEQAIAGKVNSVHTGDKEQLSTITVAILLENEVPQPRYYDRLTVFLS